MIPSDMILYNYDSVVHACMPVEGYSFCRHGGKCKVSKEVVKRMLTGGQIRGQVYREAIKGKSGGEKGQGLYGFKY